MSRLLRRFGLRARIIIAFGIGALLLSVLLSVVAFSLTRTNILNQRQSEVTSQAISNAGVVRQQAVRDATIDTLLNSLQTPTGSRPIIYLATTGEGKWFSLDPQFGELSLPHALRDSVLRGEPARMRFQSDGVLQLAIGIPLPARHAAYFEVVSIEEIDRNLESLGLILFGTALLTTMAGAAFGFYASRRVLRPLAALGRAAQEVAAGNLDIRLGESEDPDLDPITRSFDDMVSTLANRLERDAQFASDVSHELRSPLMTLSASIEVLETRRDDLPDERAVAALDLLVADVDRFRQLVEDLLEISRFDAGVVQLELDDVHLAELVMQAVAMSGDDVPVDLDADLAGSFVMADKRRLVRVIANLLDNARKYAGGATRVAVVKVDDEHVQISVEDAGEGVAPEDREKIFERFSRAGSAGRRGSTEGVGLGLALVAEHVKLHGGRVFVDDRLDGEPGARFVVDLPLEKLT